MKNIYLHVFSTCLLACLSLTGKAFASWQELAEVISPFNQTSNTYNNKYHSPDNTISNIQWDLYYSNSDWHDQKKYHPKGEHSLLIASGQSGGTSHSSQISTRFVFDESHYNNADKIRISFDLQLLTKEVVIDIGLGGWEEIIVGPEWRRARGVNNALFQFGFYDLAGQTYIPAVINIDGDLNLCSDYDELWSFPSDKNKASVSFEIEAADLRTGGDGYALMIGNSWSGGNNDGEYFYVDNLKMEKLLIPEPSSTILGSLAVIFLISKRRKR